jgi:hypothetical protein
MKVLGDNNTVLPGDPEFGNIFCHLEAAVESPTDYPLQEVICLGGEGEVMGDMGTPASSSSTLAAGSKARMQEQGQQGVDGSVKQDMQQVPQINQTSVSQPKHTGAMWI